ncbi:MAG: diacylglycerol kinase family lipid kinase [Treponema sp.]|jgi:YegS/Rv2252/BmrU family lipid kinase|nr:diacylglycerol kinase family lipid kinase [Treponema sp.]
MTVPKNKKFLVILNPVAGKGKALKAYPRIDRFLKERRVDYEIVLTEGPGHAREIAANCPAADETIVVAAGGDGTNNEVINGLLTRKDSPPEPPLFGIIPVGRGNDFASSARIPGDPDRALDILIRGKILSLDAGLVTGGFFPGGRHFINGVGIGFDTKVGFEAAKMKSIHSALSYALGAIITIARYEPSPLLEIAYDDKTITLPAAIVSVVNGRRMGGMFFMGPNAILNDGLLDICSVRHPATRRRLIRIVLSYPKGGQGKFEETLMDRGRHFRLRALKGGMAAHCDGETVCEDGKELTISCRPGALRLICDAGEP